MTSILVEFLHICYLLKLTLYRSFVCLDFTRHPSNFTRHFVFKGISELMITDTYFIHRHQNPKNEQKLKFQASLYKYIPVVTPTVTTPLSDLS